MFHKGTWRPTPCAITITNPDGHQLTPTHRHCSTRGGKQARNLNTERCSAPSDPEDLRLFLLQCQIMFNARPQNFTSESAKVFFAISYLKKSALEWFEQGRLEDDLTQAPEWKSSWTEFVKELQTHFRPTNPIGTVEVDLQHLTIASGACLYKYFVRFNTLASRVEWGDAALRFQFDDILPDRL